MRSWAEEPGELAHGFVRGLIEADLLVGHFAAGVEHGQGTGSVNNIDTSCFIAQHRCCTCTGMARSPTIPVCDNVVN